MKIKLVEVSKQRASVIHLRAHTKSLNHKCHRFLLCTILMKEVLKSLELVAEHQVTPPGVHLSNHRRVKKPYSPLKICSLLTVERKTKTKISYSILREKTSSILRPS